MQEGVVGSLVPADRLREVTDSTHGPKQRALLNAFRNKNLPVIFVNLDMTSNPTSVPAYGQMFMRYNASPAGTHFAPQDPKRLEVIPALAPLPGEPVLFNWFFSAFAHSGLDEELRKHDVETIVFFGGALHIAVYNAAIEAVDLCYSVIVPQDACIPTESGNYTPEMVKTREVFLDMFNKYTLVTTADDIIAHLP
jgi:nicotinamidase-related amidase